MSTRRALVVGYFSTVGDLEVLDVVRSWLAEHAVVHDVSAYATDVRLALDASVAWDEIDPQDYTHLVLVCGPFWRDFFVRNEFDLDRFRHCVRIGVNLSMIAPLDDYDPLDAVVGRDSDRWTHPDLSFLVKPARLPVVGLCLAPPQREYGDDQLHERAGAMLREAARSVGAAVQVIDTRWPESRNDGAVDSAAAFESILSRVDVLLTTRLHGAVLALKNGVPAVVLDPVAGGDKVVRQMKAVGWPATRRADQAVVEQVVEDLRWCLSPGALAAARAAAQRGRDGARSLREPFLRSLTALSRGAVADTAPRPEPTLTRRRGARVRHLVARGLRYAERRLR